MSTPGPIEQCPPATGQTLAYASAPMPEAPAGWTNVELFALRPEALEPFLRLVIVLQVTIPLMVSGAMLGVLALLNPGMSGQQLMIIVGAVVAVTAVSAGIRIFRTAGRQRRIWHLYRVAIADQGLIVANPDRAPVTILRSEVRRITEGHDAFRVQLGVSTVTIPKRLDPVERVRERLAQWMPVQEGAGVLGLSFQIGFTIALALANVVGYAVGVSTGRRDMLIGCIAGTVVAAGLAMFRVARERSHSRAVRVLAVLNFLCPVFLVLRWVFFAPRG